MFLNIFPIFKYIQNRFLSTKIYKNIFSKSLHTDF